MRLPLIRFGVNRRERMGGKEGLSGLEVRNGMHEQKRQGGVSWGDLGVAVGLNKGCEAWAWEENVGLKGKPFFRQIEMCVSVSM